MDSAPGIVVVDRAAVEQALEQVERALGPDAANLVRAYLAQLESKLRIYELERDENPYTLDG